MSEAQEITGVITEEQKEAVKALSGFVEYRGISAETARYFGVRTECDQETAEPIKRYYPVTKDSILVGYKGRKHPKDFVNQNVGYAGKNSDMFGQFRFTMGGRDVLICGGEEDMLSSYQMLRNSQVARGKTDYEPIAVISGTVGESTTAKQAQLQYQFLNKFNRIIVCMDNDAAGREAQEKLIKVLPKGKAFVMAMRKKDANEYLQAGLEKEFVRDFYDCKQWTPAGLFTSDALYQAAIEYVGMERLALPKFLGKLNTMLGGGLPRSCAAVLTGASSIGKTVVINQIVTEWVLNTTENVGILSLEATAGEYATNLLSYYLKTKFSNIADKEERVKLMTSEASQIAAKKLFQREDGSARFVVCDDRGASLSAVEAKMEEMVRAMGITVLVVDVATDLFAGLGIDEQEKHMAWQKKIVKETGLIIFNVMHIRKASSNQQAGSRGAEVTDESIMGSSTIYKSASVIIALVRDKMAEDEVERNTTYVRLLKNRSNGITGSAGELLYVHSEHTLTDKQEWVANNGGEF